MTQTEASLPELAPPTVFMVVSFDGVYETIELKRKQTERYVWLSEGDVPPWLHEGSPEVHLKRIMFEQAEGFRVASIKVTDGDLRGTDLIADIFMPVELVEKFRFDHDICLKTLRVLMRQDPLYNASAKSGNEAVG